MYDDRTTNNRFVHINIIEKILINSLSLSELVARPVRIFIYHFRATCLGLASAACLFLPVCVLLLLCTLYVCFYLCTVTTVYTVCSTVQSMYITIPLELLQQPQAWTCDNANVVTQCCSAHFKGFYANLCIPIFSEPILARSSKKLKCHRNTKTFYLSLYKVNCS